MTRSLPSSRTEKIFANAKSTVFVYSLKDGKLLWQAPVQGNYQASCDICYVKGTLWVGGHNPTQYNVETGAIIKKIVQKMTGPMGHDRCYRNYITERYFINSKTGGADFLELETSKEFPHHWIRGGCGMGVLPANGLVYSTPYSCQCSMGGHVPGDERVRLPPTQLASLRSTHHHQTFRAAGEGAGLQQDNGHDPGSQRRLARLSLRWFPQRYHESRDPRNAVCVLGD